MPACPACRYPVPYTPIQCPTCGKGLAFNETVWIGANGQAVGGAARRRGGVGSLVLALLFGGLGFLGTFRLILLLSEGYAVSVYSFGILIALFVAAFNRFMTWSRSSR